MGTDALVSLAWTGEALSSVSSPDAFFSESHGGSSSPYIESRSTSVIAAQEANPRLHLRPELSTSNSSRRRSVFRKSKEAGIQQPSRPWTLAMAITDDGITDESFVDDLENMRIKQEAGKLPSPDPRSLGLCTPPSYQLLDSYTEYPLQPHELEQDSNPPLDSSWTSARQALLLCRELIRTERRYISSLKTLITNGTSSPPPPEMLPYLPGLITTSEAFLGLMEQNPSVQGVSEAFLALSGNLNDSFVSWCRVVGQFFDSEESARSKGDSEGAVERSPSGKSRKPRSRATSMRSQTAESGLSVVISEPNKIRRNTKSRPTVRDLAIQPTQRIMRYVLLFKGTYTIPLKQKNHIVN